MSGVGSVGGNDGNDMLSEYARQIQDDVAKKDLDAGLVDGTQQLDANQNLDAKLDPALDSALVQGTGDASDITDPATVDPAVTGNEHTDGGTVGANALEPLDNGESSGINAIDQLGLSATDTVLNVEALHFDAKASDDAVTVASIAPHKYIQG